MRREKWHGFVLMWKSRTVLTEIITADVFIQDVYHPQIHIKSAFEGFGSRKCFFPSWLKLNKIQHWMNYFLIRGFFFKESLPRFRNHYVKTRANSCSLKQSLMEIVCAHEKASPSGTIAQSQRTRTSNRHINSLELFHMEEV